MEPTSTFQRCASLLLLVSLLILPVRAQRPTPTPQRRAATPTGTLAPATQTPAPKSQTQSVPPEATFDTLLAADTYAIYGELRAVGQYIKSDEVKEMLPALSMSGEAPKELSKIVDFLNAHADALGTARVMFAAVPVKTGVPEALVAIEMPSVEDAEKFAPQLREFVAMTIAPLIKPDENKDANATLVIKTPVRRRARLGAQTQGAVHKATTNTPAAAATAPFYLERSGRLLAMSDKAFTFASLRSNPGEKLLADSPGFQAARSRLSSETLFIYFNTTLIERNSQRQREEYERQAKARENKTPASLQADPALFPPDSRPLPYGDPKSQTQREPQQSSEASDLNSNANNSPRIVAQKTETVVIHTDIPATQPTPASSIIADPQLMEDEPPVPEEHKKLTPEEEAQERQREQSRQFDQAMQMVIFGGGPLSSSSSKWPESIGVGATFEGDALVVRALLVGDPDTLAVRPIPFVPFLLSGPALRPEAAGVLPADSDIIAGASLDLPQMYDYLASMLRILDLAASASRQNKNGSFESQLGSFEKEHGFRIKEELLASLGNEIAVSLPAQYLGVRVAGHATFGEGKSSPSGPVFVISLRDKKALQAVLPRVLETIGLKGVSEQSLIEKQGEAEMLTFSKGSVAFLDHFLVMSSDAATMRHIIESYNNHETLSSSEAFRNAISWQPGQMIGQIYVSNALLKGMFEDTQKSIEDIDDAALREYLTRLNPEPGAITHVVSKDGNGLLHELHVPKNLLALVSAQGAISTKLAPVRSNEGMARWKLQVIAQTEENYRQANGKYGALEELKAFSQKDSKDEASDGEEEYNPLDGVLTGYTLKLNASGDKFEATATPNEYRKTGRRSFYIDQTGILRGGDFNGRPASAENPPVN